MSMSAKKSGAKARAKSFNYSTSPLLATPTPPWRSKLLVALVGLGFALLLGRAVYVQIIDAPFFLKQGEIRYGHTIELPASRGRIVDRNGLILAASIPAPSIWAIPKDLEGDAASRARERASPSRSFGIAQIEGAGTLAARIRPLRSTMRPRLAGSSIVWP